MFSEDDDWVYLDPEEEHLAWCQEREVRAGLVAPTGGLRRETVTDVDGHLLWIGPDALLVPGPYGGGFLGGLVVVDAETDDTPAVTITTGVARGSVRFYSEALALPPCSVEAYWEDVVELSVRVDQGPLAVEGGLDRGPSPERRLDGHGPGWYRLRVHAANRDLEDGEATAPWERYLVQAWPEEGPRAGLVFRQRSTLSHRLLSEDEVEDSGEPAWLRATDERPDVLPLGEGWVEPASTVHFDRPLFPRPAPTPWDEEGWEGLLLSEGPDEPASYLRERYMELLLGRPFDAASAEDAARLASALEDVDEETVRRRVREWSGPEAEPEVEPEAKEGPGPQSA